MIPPARLPVLCPFGLALVFLSASGLRVKAAPEGVAEVPYVTRALRSLEGAVVGTAFAVDGDGHRYVAGKSSHFAGDCPEGAGAVFAAKFAPDGALLWKHGDCSLASEGGSGPEVVGLVVLPGGASYQAVSGSTRLTLEAGIGVVSGSAILEKRGVTGLPEWARVLEEPGAPGDFAGIAPTVDDGIVIGGSFPLGSWLNWRFLERRNRDGQRVWARSVKALTTSSFSVRGLAAGPDGNTYLVGRYGGHLVMDDGLELAQTGIFETSRFYLACYGPDGERKWFRPSGAGFDRGNRRAQLLVEAGGDLLVADTLRQGTHSAAFGSLPLVSAGPGGWVVARFDNTGRVRWARTFPGDPRDGVGLRLASDRGGGVLAVGRFDPSQSASDSAASFTAPGVSLARLDAEGRIVWWRALGGSKTASPDPVTAVQAVAVDPNGNVQLAANVFHPGIDFDRYRLVPAPKGDFAVLTLGTSLAVPLMIRQAGSEIRLSWRDDGNRFQIESSATMRGGGLWVPEPEVVPVRLGDDWSVSVRAVGGQKWFRLGIPVR